MLIRPVTTPSFWYAAAVVEPSTETIRRVVDTYLAGVRTSQIKPTANTTPAVMANVFQCLFTAARNTRSVIVAPFLVLPNRVVLPVAGRCHRERSRVSLPRQLQASTRSKQRLPTRPESATPTPPRGRVAPADSLEPTRPAAPAHREPTPMSAPSPRVQSKELSRSSRPQPRTVPRQRCR